MNPESTMNPEVHGHEVINMMLASGVSYSRETLIEAITGQFGPETRFYTCSASGMTAGELIDFLAVREKFTGTQENFTFNPARACNH